MAKEVLIEIKEAEKTGENLYKQAQAKAREIIKSAEEKANEELILAQRKADEAASEIISKKEGEAQIEIEQILKAANRQCEAIKNIPDEKVEKAVELVIERIVKLNGAR